MVIIPLLGKLNAIACIYGLSAHLLFYRRPITGTVCVEKYKMQSLTLFRNELKTMIAKQEVKIENLTKNTKIRNEVIKQNNQMAEILSKLKENY